jgi:5-oxoprolinase (ATP-hydrolysing) subunit A
MPQPVDLTKKIILDPRVQQFTDLNTDFGQSRDEAFFKHSDYELLNTITSVSIPCGVHDADPVRILELIRLARYYNCSVGAHIGYPNPASCGYEPMVMDPDSLSAWIYVQIGTLQALLKSENMEIASVRPHGALYAALLQDVPLALAMGKALKKMGSWFTLIAPDSPGLQAIAADVGLRTAPEFYLGKKYTLQGLPDLSPNNAFLPPQATMAQARQLLEQGTVLTDKGESVKVAFKTLHISPRLPQCVDIASRIGQLLIQPVSLPLADIGASGWL